MVFINFFAFFLFAFVQPPISTSLLESGGSLVYLPAVVRTVDVLSSLYDGIGGFGTSHWTLLP